MIDDIFELSRQFLINYNRPQTPQCLNIPAALLKPVFNFPDISKNKFR